MSNSQLESLTEVWGRLVAGGAWVDHSYGIPTLSVGVSIADGDVRLGIGTDTTPVLLLPVGAREQAPSVEIGDEIHVGTIDLLLGQRPLRFIEVKCCSVDLASVFLDLAHQILSRLQRGELVLQAVVGAVDDFRTLLRRAFSRWSQREKVGLFGELHFLLVLARRLGCHGITSWVGPDGGRHDFCGPYAAVEVKSSIRSSSRDITISAIDQLESPIGGSLFLLHQRFEQSGSGGHDFSDLIRALALAGIGESEISAKLQGLGLTIQDLNADDLRLRLEASDYYLVSDSFPRITTASFVAGGLPCGIRRLEYVVDLSVASGSGVSVEDVISAIGQVSPKNE